MSSAEVHSGLEQRTQDDTGINPYQLHTHLLRIRTRGFLCYRLCIAIPILKNKKKKFNNQCWMDGWTSSLQIFPN